LGKVACGLLYGQVFFGELELHSQLQDNKCAKLVFSKGFAGGNNQNSGTH
jgi:hypothetical protein